jgi:hypothetical protein
MAQSADPNDNRGVRPPPDVNPRTDPALDFPDKPFHQMTPGDYDVLGFCLGWRSTSSWIPGPSFSADALRVNG